MSQRERHQQPGAHSAKWNSAVVKSINIICVYPPLTRQHVAWLLTSRSNVYLCASVVFCSFPLHQLDKGKQLKIQKHMTQFN